MLWAACGVVGAVCRGVCATVWRACGGVHAVMIAQCAVVVAVRDVVRARGFCLYAVCECAMACVGCRCALVLGDTRRDADVVLC